MKCDPRTLTKRFQHLGSNKAQQVGAQGWRIRMDELSPNEKKLYLKRDSDEHG
jgi:hypothetical protein